MDKYQDELDKIINWCNLFNETKFIKEKIDYSFNTMQEALNELYLTRKALLICASKLGYEEDKCDKCEFGGNGCLEPETQEEAQAISIDHQYTRPKKIAHKMLEIAKTDRYNLQTDIALKYWDSEVGNER